MKNVNIEVYSYALYGKRLEGEVNKLVNKNYTNKVMYKTNNIKVINKVCNYLNNESKKIFKNENFIHDTNKNTIIYTNKNNNIYCVYCKDTWDLLLIEK